MWQKYRVSQALHFEILKNTEIFPKYLTKYFKIKNTVFFTSLVIRYRSHSFPKSRLILIILHARCSIPVTVSTIHGSRVHQISWSEKKFRKSETMTLVILQVNGTNLKQPLLDFIGHSSEPSHGCLLLHNLIHADECCFHRAEHDATQLTKQN